MAGLMADAINTKTLVIEPEMLDIIAELDEFKGAWRALSTLAPERLAALRRVATIESIGSSTRIEGSTLSDKEIEKILSNVEIRSFETRDEQEVAGYAGVMETIFASWSVLTLTENHVRQLHSDLLRYSTKDERHRGDYKKLDNHVEAFDATGKSVGVVFQTASPFDTPRRMRELVEWTTGALASRTLHPLLVLAVFVVVFLHRNRVAAGKPAMKIDVGAALGAERAKFVDRGLAANRARCGRRDRVFGGLRNVRHISG